MRPLYLIDGYNVIFCLKKVFTEKDNISNGREKLTEMMLDYGAHNDAEVIIVFDGQNQSLKESVHKLSHSVKIVFTPARMTADSYIEKQTYQRRGEYRHIYVVTSDGPEQNQVLGSGAYRIAVEEFWRMVSQDKKIQRDFIQERGQQLKRREIGGEISQEVRDKLDKLRKSGKKI
ncbi:MAG TPA: tetracycline resistance protein [Veillonellaceae bacterium]|jgi:predicted RNA-binding protein with PIN domain|nr:tetracycline resistance protein [Veillonellaceae bacterium]